MDVGILASIFNFILLLVQIYYWGMIISLLHGFQQLENLNLGYFFFFFMNLS